MKKNIWIGIGVVGVIIVILVVIGYSSKQNSTFTVYPVFCKDWGNNPPTTEDFANCQRPYAYARETFVVDQAKDQITETSPDNSSFYTLSSCTIQDNEHWGCGQSYDAFGAVEPSRSGDQFSENGAYGTPVDTIFVTESQWDSINNGAASTEN